MVEHTPRPWSVNEWPQANADMSVGAVGTPRVAIIPIRDVSINEQRANAKLIAAAPELLDEYENLLLYLKAASEACLAGQSDVAEDLCHEYADFNSPAIAKAKGEPKE